MSRLFIEEEKLVECGSTTKLLLDAEDPDRVYTLDTKGRQLDKGYFVLDPVNRNTYTIHIGGSLRFEGRQRIYDFQGDVKDDIGVFAYTSRGEMPDEYNTWYSWLGFFTTSDMRPLRNPIQIYREEMEMLRPLIKTIGGPRESKPRIGHLHISSRHDFVVIVMKVEDFYCFRIYNVSTGLQMYESQSLGFLLVGTVHWHNNNTVRWLEGKHGTVGPPNDMLRGSEIQLWTASLVGEVVPQRLFTVHLGPNQTPMESWFGERMSGAEGGEESIGGVGVTGNGLVYADVRCMKNKEGERGWLKLQITPEGRMDRAGRVCHTEGELWDVQMDCRYPSRIDGRYGVWGPLDGKCIVRDLQARERMLALCMSQHPRLGQFSDMRMLGSVLRDSICFSDCI